MTNYEKRQQILTKYFKNVYYMNGYSKNINFIDKHRVSIVYREEIPNFYLSTESFSSDPFSNKIINLPNDATYDNSDSLYIRIPFCTVNVEDECPINNVIISLFEGFKSARIFIEERDNSIKTYYLLYFHYPIKGMTSLYIASETLDFKNDALFYKGLQKFLKEAFDWHLEINEIMFNLPEVFNTLKTLRY